MYPRRRDIGCLDCSRYEVTALMIGLVEYAGRGRGFGHMNGFAVQFVLQSVKQTWAKDLSARYRSSDYSRRPVRFPTGHISGMLQDAEGRPIPDADLTLYDASDHDAHIEDDSATTDKRGRFHFAVPPGEYVIGFNTFWPPSKDFPFPSSYFAARINLKDGDHRNGVILRAGHTLVVRRVPIRVAWPDASPVADANVWLSQKSDPTSVVGILVSHTAADGTFQLTGFEGIDYILHADKYSGLARVSCARSVLIPAGQSAVPEQQLSLNITDFEICKNIEFEVPREPAAK